MSSTAGCWPATVGSYCTSRQLVGGRPRATAGPRLHEPVGTPAASAVSCQRTSLCSAALCAPLRNWLLTSDCSGDRLAPANARGAHGRAAVEDVMPDFEGKQRPDTAAFVGGPGVVPGQEPLYQRLVEDLNDEGPGIQQPLPDRLT